MHHHVSKYLCLAALLLLAGCAAKPPLQTEGVDLSIQPPQAVAAPAELRGSKVVWGGVIISSRNLADATEIEVLSFPLDEQSLWPQADQEAQGRFLLRHPGYLETLDYAPGRYLSAVGTLRYVQRLKVGESEVDYPVMDASELHLWRSKPEAGGTRFHFGFGLILSN